MNVDEFLEHSGVRGMHWGIIHEKEKDPNRSPKKSIVDDVGAVLGVKSSVDKKNAQESHKKAAEEGIALGKSQAKAVEEYMSGRNKNVSISEGESGYRTSQVSAAINGACRYLTQENVDKYNSENCSDEDVKHIYAGVSTFNEFIEQVFTYGTPDAASAVDQIESYSKYLDNLRSETSEDDSEFLKKERKIADQMDREIDRLQAGLGMKRVTGKTEDEMSRDELVQNKAYDTAHAKLAEAMYFTGLATTMPKRDPGETVAVKPVQKEEQKAMAKHDGIDVDTFLQHSGVPGMRWGKRQYQYPDGSLTPLGRVHYGYGPKKDKKPSKTKEYEYTSKTKKYNADEARHLTDAELSARTKRLNAELAYRDAVKRNHDVDEPKYKKAFKKIFIDTLGDVATSVAKKTFTAAFNKAIDSILPGLNSNNDSGGKSEKKKKTS